MRYDHRAIEKKWQQYWLENRTFKAEFPSEKPKYYCLDMFPYPSGAGLHVGHVEGYTATDIVSRHKRQKGFNVLHPMGWDSFGLPAEQYAVRTGTHPRDTTTKNIDNFRRQLRQLGISYDWDRELATSDPKYYKWTQWIFTKLYEKGLAYEAEMMVNYCPALGTVLANEEIEDGKAKEGGHAIERRPLKQWVLKITEYAERLLQDLDELDWSDGLKALQRNWIGRSVGAHVDFEEPTTGSKISIFTTCPHTLPGATFVVLAPEHPLVDKITTADQKAAVDAYRQDVAAKSDLQRTDLAKHKTGVFTGGYAINPVTEQPVPIWIADYVLMSYGTGAVMAVPAHDERDFEFAQKFDLPITAVVDPEMELLPADPELSQEQMRQQILAGERCWIEDGQMFGCNHNGLQIDGLNVAEAKKAIVKWLEQKGRGKGTVTYKLRDWLFSRQRYWGEPFPILHLADGTKRVLTEEELPLVPPDIEDFKPAGDGRSPLAKATDWVEITDPVTGQKAMRETNTMPQWAGSCWYYLRFLDPHNDNAAWGEAEEKYWMPVDLYVGGVEHAVLHLLYARFWHKVLFDCGLVHTKEPFQTLRNQGLIVSRSFQQDDGNYVYPEQVKEKDGQYFHRETGEHLRSQVDKMSKSKLNGVSPDDIIDEFGADALRLYEMFMGPLDKEKIWNTDAVSGCRRFLQRMHTMITSEKVCEEQDEQATKLAHRLAHGVAKDTEALMFNTAIAKMMEFVNDYMKLDRYPKDGLRIAVQCLSPYAPHLAEELWAILGSEGELSYAPFPKADPRYLEDEQVTYIVQVNGKLRGRLELPKGRAEQEILELAQRDPTIAKHIDGKETVKTIFVPNKLINIVCK